MRIRRAGEAGEPARLQMTAMIDIVFLLLVFFVMTFQIVPIEGDFLLELPRKGAAADSPCYDLSLRLRLMADAEGRLAGMALNSRKIAPDFDALQNLVVEIVGDQRGPGSVAATAELEIQCDYGLKYEHVIAALTASTGYVTDDGKTVSLLEKVTFSPPRP